MQFKLLLSDPQPPRCCAEPWIALMAGVTSWSRSKTLLLGLSRSERRRCVKLVAVQGGEGGRGGIERLTPLCCLVLRTGPTE